jgi:hypothetical protein
METIAQFRFPICRGFVDFQILEFHAEAVRRDFVPLLKKNTVTNERICAFKLSRQTGAIDCSKFALERD